MIIYNNHQSSCIIARYICGHIVGWIFENRELDFCRHVLSIVRVGTFLRAVRLSGGRRSKTTTVWQNTMIPNTAVGVVAPHSIREASVHNVPIYTRTTVTTTITLLCTICCSARNVLTQPTTRARRGNDRERSKKTKNKNRRKPSAFLFLRKGRNIA